MVAPEGAWHFRVLDLSMGNQALTTDPITEVYPNPASTITCIQVAVHAVAEARIELIDAVGRQVMLVSDGRIPADGRYFVDLTRLPAGPYQVVVTTSQGRAVARLLHH